MFCNTKYSSIITRLFCCVGWFSKAEFVWGGLFSQDCDVNRSMFLTWVGFKPC